MFIGPTRTADPLEIGAVSDNIDTSDLKPVETSTLRAVAELIDQRGALDDDLTKAVRTARQSGRSWAEIAAMLGVSKQAAQQKYGPLSTAS